MVLSGWRRCGNGLNKPSSHLSAPGASGSTIWGQILGTGKRSALTLNLNVREIRKDSTSRAP